MLTFTAALRTAAVAAALATVAVTAPQAVAAQDPAPTVSAKADATTRAIAKSDPQAVAAATVCGSGYALSKAVPLPLGTDPNLRLGTLFAYENGGKGCAILDNNVGKSQYMYLRVCKAGGTSCDTDTGSFSQYAGPVYVSSFACAPVTARMGNSSGSLYIDYASDYVFPCG
ncbi:hypothetical protein [Streptomyces sp. NBC_00670]|jgi:hypothetical protein|uniref:hypothetical protein n=1 Tax=Streptomyces sp. NBC_00670 TaxID=2975804 RepID=UPI002E2F889B|nr:hypothetical protein [Streptomyces sp. NBC_00670]